MDARNGVDNTYRPVYRVDKSLIIPETKPAHHLCFFSLNARQAIAIDTPTLPRNTNHTVPDASEPNPLISLKCTNYGIQAHLNAPPNDRLRPSKHADYANM